MSLIRNPAREVKRLEKSNKVRHIIVGDFGLLLVAYAAEDPAFVKFGKDAQGGTRKSAITLSRQTPEQEVDLLSPFDDLETCSEAIPNQQTVAERFETAATTQIAEHWIICCC